MEPGANRNDLGKLHDTMLDTMPMKLEELINTIHRLGGEEITSLVADESLGWALEVAVKMRIRRVAFSPASAAMLAMLFSIPKLIQEKLIDFDGQINNNSFLIKLMNLTSFLFIQNHMPNSMLY
ncbi:hypothetical protein IC582_020668 [Cucumis melo]|uniref:UDP-glycosyltransferase 83A1-like n=1 Tax=Cucumis melo TaxID=3656 RepID=A0A9I9DQC7_CUCME